ncbi:glucosamine-6-phosphate deaminase [Thalassobacillus hwangdonensis]|uniref:Glucosamine-6-phosphate deaminase n=1 Tax=Thalassobacillus hwangdonensis TaxID=546108 RepID=A0ABW3L1S9_9BACI
MKTIIVENYQKLSAYAAEQIIKEVDGTDHAVLGLATGSTPVGTYEYLRNFPERFKGVTTFNLDEYIGLDKKDTNSYWTFMKEQLFNHVPFQENNIPDGNADDLKAECHRYEAQIRNSGGIDLQILGLGNNGHIGFNEPDTSFDSRTHVVDLSETTRQANARFFQSIDHVPTKAITMGIHTIMESKRILLLVSGKGKSDAVERLLNGRMTEDFPASILHHHPDVTVVIDQERVAGKFHMAPEKS